MKNNAVPVEWERLDLKKSIIKIMILYLHDIYRFGLKSDILLREIYSTFRNSYISLVASFAYTPYMIPSDKLGIRNYVKRWKDKLGVTAYL